MRRRILTVLLLIFTCSLSACYASKQRAGEQVVARVEAFRKAHGRLPVNLDEIGIEEKLEGPVFYRKESESRYIVWYGTTLGESVTYDSERKRWE